MKTNQCILQGTMVFITEGKYKAKQAVITRLIGDVFQLELFDGHTIVLRGDEIERV